MVDIHPNAIVRLKDGPTYFGLSDAQITAKIKSGEIPKPIALSATGRAKGWLGKQILENQAQLLARADSAA